MAHLSTWVRIKIAVPKGKYAAETCTEYEYEFLQWSYRVVAKSTESAAQVVSVGPQKDALRKRKQLECHPPERFLEAREVHKKPSNKCHPPAMNLLCHVTQECRNEWDEPLRVTMSDI